MKLQNFHCVSWTGEFRSSGESTDLGGTILGTETDPSRGRYGVVQQNHPFSIHTCSRGVSKESLEKGFLALIPLLAVGILLTKSFFAFSKLKKWSYLFDGCRVLSLKIVYVKSYSKEAAVPNGR